MTKKILSLLLIASIAVTSIFASVTYSSTQGELTGSDMKIVLDSTVDDTDYEFRFVRASDASGTVDYDSLLGASAISNDEYTSSSVTITADDSVGLFGIVSSIGNKADDFTATVTVTPTNFVGTGTLAQTGPLPTVKPATDSSFDSKYTANAAGNIFTSPTYLTGRNIKKVISAFSLEWTGNPDLRPDTYTSTTTIAIIIS
jgi:hypothetical protein